MKLKDLGVLPNADIVESMGSCYKCFPDEIKDIDITEALHKAGYVNIAEVDIEKVETEKLYQIGWIKLSEIEIDKMKVREGVYKIISEMLDNPGECEIYNTSKCYESIENFIAENIQTLIKVKV